MKIIKKEHRNAVKLTAREKNLTDYVDSIHHPIGGSLQTEIRKDNHYYYFLTHGRWGMSCAITHADYQKLQNYERGYEEFLNDNAIDVI